MPNFSVNITASAVAWYAAIVATIAAGISFYNAWRDRPHIKLSYQSSWVMGAAPTYDEGKSYFTITVRNAGKRAIKIGNVGIKLYDGQALLFADSVMGSQNRVLSEEHPRTDFLTEESTLPPREQFYRIEVNDEAGGKHYKYFSSIPTFRKWWCRLIKVSSGSSSILTPYATIHPETGYTN